MNDEVNFETHTNPPWWNRIPVKVPAIEFWIYRVLLGALVLFAVVHQANAQGLIINGEATTTLTWTPPTQYTDGSTLDPADLGGYVIYWDTQSGVGRCSSAPATKLDPCYANALDTGDGTLSSQVVTLNLNGDTTMHFAAIAYVGDGSSPEQLSAYSNESVKQFTLVVTAPPNPPIIQSIDMTIICTTNQPDVTCTFDVQ